MKSLQSELTGRVSYVESKKIWKINVQRDGVRKSFYSKLPERKGINDCATKAAAWILSESPLTLSARTTVDDLFALFLQDKEKETTDVRNIKSRYQNHIKPIIGSKRIAYLTNQDLKRVISTANSEHHLSHKTLLNIRGDLSGFCNYLYNSNIRSDLRTSNIKIPKNAPLSKKKSLDLVSLYILFTQSSVIFNGAVCQDELVYAHRFQVVTGLRTGELMGLEWGDIDDTYIHIRRSINDKSITTDGKNVFAQRDFPQTRHIRELLNAQKQHRINPHDPHERVFGEFKQLTYRERWGKFCAYNHISYVSPYELRHTFKSLYKGEFDSNQNLKMQDWVIEELMGHVHPGMGGVYGHMLDGDMDAVPNLLDSILDARLAYGKELYFKKFCENPDSPDF